MDGINIFTFSKGPRNPKKGSKTQQNPKKCRKLPPAAQIRSGKRRETMQRWCTKFRSLGALRPTAKPPQPSFPILVPRSAIHISTNKSVSHTFFFPGFQPLVNVSQISQPSISYRSPFLSPTVSQNSIYNIFLFC